MHTDRLMAEGARGHHVVSVLASSRRSTVKSACLRSAPMKWAMSIYVPPPEIMVARWRAFDLGRLAAASSSDGLDASDTGNARTPITFCGAP